MPESLEEPPFCSFAFLDNGQVLALSKHKSYKKWYGWRGIKHNLSDACQIIRERTSYSETFQLEITPNSGPSVSVLPFILIVPIIGRLRLSYEIGVARHSFITNRMNKDVAQLPFTTLVGKSRVWICSSESNCRVFGRAVANLLSDNEICEVVKHCSHGNASKVYKEFSEDVMKELEIHALACRERDQRIQDAMSEYDGHYNVLAFQKSWQRSKHGYLTGDDSQDVEE